jgi:hypothetical protein
VIDALRDLSCSALERVADGGRGGIADDDNTLTGP